MLARRAAFNLSKIRLVRSFAPVFAFVSGASKRSLAVITIALLVLAGIAATTQTIRAATATIPVSQSDMMEGTYQYGSIAIDKKAETVQLQKASVGVWSKESDSGLVNPPFSILSNSNMVYGPNNTLYVMGDYNQQCHLAKYEIDQKRWTELSMPPHTCGYGNMQLIYDQNASLYYLAGGSQYDFTATLFRYDISSNTWHKLESMPTTLSNVTSATYVTIGSNAYIYAIRGTQIPVFWQYSIKNNAWTMMASYGNTTGVGNGLMLAWDRSNYIYGIVSGTGEFKKYNLGLNTWTSLPMVDNTSERRSSLIYANGLLYDFRTSWSNTYNRSATLYAYDPVKDMWDNKGTIPAPSQEYSHPLAYTFDGKSSFYALAGYDRLMNLYRYDIDTESWAHSSLLDSSTGMARVSRMPFYAGNGTAYYTGGWNGDEAIYRYTYIDNNKFTVKSAPEGVKADVLVVGGGGGGGGYAYAGGGGGGGVVLSEQFPLETNKKYDVVVGAGGSSGFNYQRAQNGTNSKFGPITAIGGGGGGSLSVSSGCTESRGRDGSGGGGASRYFPANNCGIDGFGVGLNPGIGSGGTLTYFGRNRGGNAHSTTNAGGGGGGAGSPGQDAPLNKGGNGGDGVYIPYFGYEAGDSGWFGGGGGGGFQSGMTASIGGRGGGAPGVAWSGNASQGRDGVGGGGGGGTPSTTGFRANRGGNGTVIVRYPINGQPDDIVAVGGVITEFVGDGTNGVNGQRYRVHTFTDRRVENQVTRASTGLTLPGGLGIAGVYKSGSLYLPSMITVNGQNFYRYDIATNTYTNLAAAPLNPSSGATMLDGEDGYLYANFGADRSQIYRYSIAANTWEQRTSLSIGVNGGGGIVKIGRDIYALRGNNINQFIKYNIDTGVSVSINSLPSGGSGYMIGDNKRYIYIGATNDGSEDNAKIVRKYDTVTDTWTRLAEPPTFVSSYGYYDNENEALRISQGTSWSSFFEWSVPTGNYVREGTWFSKTYDVTMATAWGNLDMDIAGQGTVKVYTRTSGDKTIWSDWQQTSGAAIGSPANRYIQIKLVLSGDSSATPIVSNIRINYQKDTTPPTHPSKVSSYESKEKKTAIISGTNYPHTHPYFEWQGATDGMNGSGVSGYYIYFGLNSGADPVVDGNFQADSTYEVTTPMIAGEIYYLRMKVKDKEGNISGAQTLFSYLYYYISPPGNILKTTTADFNAGFNTNISVQDDSFSLNKQTSGVWTTGPLTQPNVTTYASTAIVVGDYIYVARGQGSTDFMRYSTIYQRWDTLRPSPAATSLGALAYDGGDTLMLLYGNNGTGIARYSITENQWTVLPTQLPQLATAGTSMTYIGDNRYAIAMGGGRNFYIYDDNEETYELKMQTPQSTNGSYGSTGLWYDGQNKLYGYFGSTPGTRLSFAVYDVNADYWRNLAEPPISSFYYNQPMAYDGKGGLYLFLKSGWGDIQRSTSQNAIRYDIESDYWSEVGGFQETTGWGTVVSDSKHYMYILPGNSTVYTKRIVRLDMLTNQFTPDTKQIEPMKRLWYNYTNNHRTWGAANITTATYDGNKYIYWLGASNDNWTNFSVLAKQNKETGETVYLAPPPVVGYSGSLGYLDGSVYYLPAKGSRFFYVFDEPTQQWNRMADTPVAVSNPGATSLVQVNGMFYVSFGGQNYYRYEPSVNGGTWTKLANSPANIYNGSFIYKADTNVIYIISGNNSRNFYRYNINNDSWTTLSLLPGAASYGSTMVLGNNTIYAQRGADSAQSYIYDIAANSWSIGNDGPGIFRLGAVAVPIDSSRAIVSAGESSSEIWQFNLPSDKVSYSGEAQHVSQPMQFDGIFTYAGVNVEADVPENTSLEVYTRTSDDGMHWDDWVMTEPPAVYSSSRRAKINSTTRRFMQVKIVLESKDNRYTPTVYGYEVDYYYDIIPPTNPTVALAYDTSDKTNQLISDKWYNHSKPLFDWPDPGEAGGATDGILGSNIAGYWVYFGNDQTANPRTAGVYVDKSELATDISTSPPGNYYLRIQAQDVTGNVDPLVFAPFIYKFDPIYPTNPSLVSVTPSGFTSKNDFSFDWPNAYDQHSGVAGYCYKTGATSGAFSVEICQNGTSLPNLSAAYRSGTNVFYVRAYDVAGNFSPYYTSASFYYTTDAPTPVTNLRAIPPVSEQNMFSFLWDLPVTFTGDPELLEYCYSVNVVPSPINTTCTKDRYIAPFKAATQVGVNVLYVVAKDEADNINWNNFASTNFIANTASPGIPLNLAVVDTSDQTSSRWALTMTWDKPTSAGNGIEGYIIERSLDGRNFEVIGRTSTQAFVDLAVAPRVLYYYRVRATDGVDNRSGPSAVVAKSAVGEYPRPPKRVVDPTAKTDHTQAIISWVTDRPSTTFIEYGLKPTEMTQSKGSLTLDDEHTVILTGLQASTTYYYRVQSFDLDRSYVLEDTFSTVYSFRTPEPARIYNVSSDAITLSSGILSWKTSVPTRTRVEYGKTIGYGLVYEDNDSDLTTNHVVKLTGLESGSVYHYKVATKTSFGGPLNSDDYTFETIARPTISNIEFQPLENEPTTAVRVSWKTNVPTTSTLYYAGSGNRQEVSSSELKTTHEVSLRGLAGSTTYSITIEGRDAFGNLGSSTTQTWQSQLDTRPPLLSDKNISVTTTDGPSGKKAQIIVSWKTDEPAVSQVQYGQAKDVNYPNTTPMDTDATTDHTVIISDLNLADIYRLQIMVRDLDGNTAYGLATTVVTPDKEASVFDSVVGLLLRLFRVQ